MIYTIENDVLRVDIENIGAELMSIYSKKTGTEYLWQGDKKYWGSRAPLLFPICGRLYKNEYTYKDKKYEMMLHGFARKMAFTVESHSKEEIVFCLTENEESLKQYPFNFVFKVKYALEFNKLTNSLYVENTDSKVMPFSIGYHPGFNVPFSDEDKYEDYYVEFDCAKEVELLQWSNNLYSHSVPYKLESGKIIRLNHRIFDNEAIFLSNVCNKVALKNTKNNKSIKLIFDDITHLGFWKAQYTDAPYVCIEPWHGIPATDGVTDDLETKAEVIKLERGKSYNNSLVIEINE